LKVLISAYSCAPGRGSEPAVGWNVAELAARRHQVWVLLDEHNRPWVEGSSVGSPPSDIQWIFVKLPWPLSRLFSIRWRGYLYYALWQVSAFFHARRLHRRIGFDLVHHVTYQNSWAPVWMGWLGIPLVWNGGRRDVVPMRLLRGLGLRGGLAELVRAALMRLFWLVTDPLVARRAAAILSLGSARLWPEGARVEPIACGGLSEAEASRLSRIPPRREEPFRIASIGRLFASKGAALALEAFARFRAQAPESEFWIIGEGPERPRLERQAARLGLADSVRFLGWRSRDELFALFEQIDVLVHPSLRDAFGYVVVEAMAAGRPVLCLDAGGAAAIVRSGGGVVLSVETPERIIEAMARTLARWALEPALREAMGAQARATALERFRWLAQEDALDGVYRQAVAASCSEQRRLRRADFAASGGSR